MKKQCPSCGGDCGYTKRRGCRYDNASIAGLRGLVDMAKAALEKIDELEATVARLRAKLSRYEP